jgi:hypothetical protein
MLLVILYEQGPKSKDTKLRDGNKNGLMNWDISHEV